MLFYFTVLLIILLDQISKWWVRDHMAIAEVIPVRSWIYELRHYENSGMAFSLFQGYARLFGMVALVFICLVLYYRYKGEIRGRFMNVGAGLLVGGAAGNMIDRFWHGTVTDFIVFSEDGGILNLADIALNLGVILFIVGLFINHFFSRTKKTKYP